MIYVGLTGWGDHEDIYTGNGHKNKLHAYSAHFPTVEIDTSFYAIQPIRHYEKWVKETPSSFQFVVKAFQGMTKHSRGEKLFESTDVMFESFLSSLEPLRASNKLAMVLCQFPPWFDCTKENVQYLRYCKDRLGDIPAALEFRHQSWFNPMYDERTLQFMREENWIHSICDEPQAGSGSIPIVPEVTVRAKTLIRFHGRNVYGWKNPGHGNWRDVRYLYRYSLEELLEWSKRINLLKECTDELFILFNNNSGGDAYRNAKQMVELLGITYQGLSPRQLELFD